MDTHAVQQLSRSLSVSLRRCKCVCVSVSATWECFTWRICISENIPKLSHTDTPTAAAPVCVCVRVYGCCAVVTYKLKTRVAIISINSASKAIIFSAHLPLAYQSSQINFPAPNTPNNRKRLSQVKANALGKPNSRGKNS